MQALPLCFAQTPQKTKQPADPESVTDTEMEQFAGVFVELQTMNQQIQQSAQQDMQKVITDSELSLDRYQAIMAAMRNDTGLQQKLQKQIQQ